MIKGLIEFWNLFRSTVKGFDTSKQLAMGVTMGMLVGLVPKDSLFSYGFGCLLLLSTANLFAGALSAFCFSWIGTIFDPLSDRLGASLLTFDLFEPTLAWLSQLPVVPWTRFENTVVTGSLVLGLLLAFPVYRISRSSCDRYQKSVQSVVRRSRLGRWLFAIAAELPAETEDLS